MKNFKVLIGTLVGLIVAGFLVFILFPKVEYDFMTFILCAMIVALSIHVYNVRKNSDFNPNFSDNLGMWALRIVSHSFSVLFATLLLATALQARGTGSQLMNVKWPNFESLIGNFGGSIGNVMDQLIAFGPNTIASFLAILSLVLIPISFVFPIIWYKDYQKLKIYEIVLNVSCLAFIVLVMNHIS